MLCLLTPIIMADTGGGIPAMVAMVLDGLELACISDRDGGDLTPIIRITPIPPIIRIIP
jgi:hypothetical protein